MNKFTLKKYVSQGETLPRFYGVAWRDYARLQAVCYPIPLNWLVFILREIYFLIAYLPKAPREKFESRVFSAGFEEGRKIGRLEGQNDLALELGAHVQMYFRMRRAKANRRENKINGK